MYLCMYLQNNFAKYKFEIQKCRVSSVIFSFSKNVDSWYVIAKYYAAASICKKVVLLRKAAQALSVDILFSSNHNIHKSSGGLCFWASVTLIEIF